MPSHRNTLHYTTIHNITPHLVRSDRRRLGSGSGRGTAIRLGTDVRAAFELGVTTFEPPRELGGELPFHYIASHYTTMHQVVRP